MLIFGTAWKWKIHEGSFNLSAKGQQISSLLSRETIGKLSKMGSKCEHDDNT